MDDKNQTIKDLKQEVAKWRGRAVEAVEQACQSCRNTDLDLCRHCRMDKIRKEAASG